MSEATTDLAAAVGRRERKKEDTRRALKQAALSLALEHGVERLTVKEITDTVDVSPRTFFNYFACKEDALVGHTDRVAAELRAAILARPAGEAPLTSLQVAVTQSELLREAHAHRDQALARQRLIHANPSLLARQLSQTASLERAIADAMSVRLGSDSGADLRPQLLAALAASVLRVALRRWAIEGTRLDELIERTFALLTSQLDDHHTSH